MNIINYFSPQPSSAELPASLNNPFDNNPHFIAIKAADLLKHKLESEISKLQSFFKKNEGKMFGVLVVCDSQGKVGYLSAFSGMLSNNWLVPGFVPPVFNIEKMQQVLEQGEQQLGALTLRIKCLKDNEKRRVLLNDLSILDEDSALATIHLKQTHKENKLNRKKHRNNVLNRRESDLTLFHLSQQSQDDKREYKALKKSIELKRLNAQRCINELFNNEIDALKTQRKQLSQSLHKKVFAQYQLLNYEGETKSLVELFDNKLPPGGTADCAAPKLVHYALSHGLKILALSEFWWGASPNKEVRHHQQFYPPCRSKCHHILPFMLQGIHLKTIEEINQKTLVPKIIFEDDFLLVLNKPEGMLSIPGKLQQYSVLSWLKEKYPNAQGALLLHRLDQATSGVMLAAKNSDVYKAIQQQFIKRSIKKRYVALLESHLVEKAVEINLPLRVDLDDRPRQLVCFEHGKHAQTRVELIKLEGDFSRVYFYPKTGRTHQLRVHAAHEFGLAIPIVGDHLYGKKANRLMLHAEQIEFVHPISHETLVFKVTVPF